MKITQWIIGLTIFSGIVIGFGLFSQSLFSTYSVNGTANISSLSRASEINQFANETAGNIQSQTGFLQTVFTSVALLWAVLIQFLSFPLIVLGLVTDISIVFNPYGGLPDWFIIMISSLIMISIAYKVAEIIANRQGEV